MFYINDKILKITKQEIYVGKFTNNDDEGYNICISLKFVNNDSINGYLNLSAGFEKTKDIDVFLNRIYNGIPFENDHQFIYFEVFDTEKFLDTEIESKIFLKLEDIKGHKVELNDELIKIKFVGYLDMKYF